MTDTHISSVSMDKSALLYLTLRIRPVEFSQQTDRTAHTGRI
jgi:hypothetical protein